MNSTTKGSWSLFGLALGLVAAATLTACGGGGDDGGSNNPQPVSSSAEGVYGGTLATTPATAFQMVVLENGDLWTLYGTQTSSTFFVQGFIQGGSTSTNGTLTSSGAKDFDDTSATAFNINATYNATAKTISGTASSPGLGSATFNGGPIPNSTYNYDAPASLSAVAGAWTVTELAGERIALNIASNGQVTAAASSGCNFSGTVTPRPSGKNVFNVSLTFGGAPCALPGQSASGIAIAAPLTGGQTQLMVAVVDSTRQFGTAAFGTR